MSNRRYSWTTVILLLFIFWPVGLYMLIRNISSSFPNGTSITGKSVIGSVLSVIGYFFVGITATILLDSIGHTFNVDLVIGLIILAFIAIILILIGRTLKKRQKTFAKYIRVLNTYNRIPLEKIAPMIPASVPQATADIEKLVEAELIYGLYIDYSTNEVVNPNAYKDYYSSVEYTSKKTVVIECKQCCASNEVPANNPGRCRYCNGPLV